MAYCFRKQSVLTYHISWVKQHSVPLSNWVCIQLLKKKKKKLNRWWEENNSLYNMTCNTKTTCIRLSNFCIKIVLYCFTNLPWKYEKTGEPYLTSLHYSHDTNSYQNSIDIREILMHSSRYITDPNSHNTIKYTILT